MKEVRIPLMGESIHQVTIGRLLVPEGAEVKEDQEIVEIETDKVNQILYSPMAGKIHWKVKEQDVALVNDLIAEIAPIDMKDQKNGRAEKQPEATPSSTPLRETKEEWVESLQQNKQPKTPFIPSEPALNTEERRPFSTIRKTIAERLVASQKEAAILTTFNEVDLTALSLLREKYKDAFTKRYKCKLGWMSFFTKAVVYALKEVPALNSYLDGQELVQRKMYDIGIAVGTEKGVIVPVIKGCDRLSWAEIETAIAGYAEKAKKGQLSLQDLQGAGFTITNGGTYGSLLSTPLLVTPQCGILGMHKIEKRAVVVEDQVVVRSMMYIALSYDHRIVDGREAVAFLVRIKELLEDPVRFLLGI